LQLIDGLLVDEGGQVGDLLKSIELLDRDVTLHDLFVSLLEHVVECDDQLVFTTVQKDILYLDLLTELAK